MESVKELILCICFPVLIISGICNFVNAILYLLNIAPAFVNAMTYATFAGWCISTLFLFMCGNDGTTGAIVFNIFVAAPTLIMLIISIFLPFPYFTSFMLSLFGYFGLLLGLAFLSNIGIINTNFHH